MASKTAQDKYDKVTTPKFTQICRSSTNVLSAPTNHAHDVTTGNTLTNDKNQVGVDAHQPSTEMPERRMSQSSELPMHPSPRPA
jgi:hypothetical protein